MKIERWLPCALLCALVCLAAAPPAGAAEPVRNLERFRHDVWDLSNGFTASSIAGIAQSHDGYLWIGSDHGLFRFDGAQFKRFFRRNTPELVGSAITCLLAESDAVWAGTEKGLVRYQQGAFRRFTAADGLPDEHISSLASGADGKVWVGTANGVAVLDRSAGRFTHGYDTFVQGLVTALTADPSGNMWIGVGRSVVRIRGTEVTAFPKLPVPLANSIYVGRSGDIWAGTDGGIFALQTKEWKDVPGPKINDVGPLSSLLQDRSGRFWVAASGGLFRADAAVLSGAAPWPEVLLRGTEISSLFEDREGSIWIGTTAGALHRYREQVFTALTRGDGLVSNYIYSIYEDSDGVLWVGTPDGLNRLEKGRITVFRAREESVGHVSAIAGAAAGGLWLGTNAGVLRFQNGRFGALIPRSRGANDFPKVVFEDRQGALWVGTRHSGLDVLSSGRWRHYSLHNGLAADSVREIRQDASGAVWVGTTLGVTRFAGNEAVIFQAPAGQPRDSTTVAFEDDEHTLWFGTSGGLRRYKDKRFVTFGAAAGIMGEVSQVLVDRSGSVWLAADDRLMRICRADLDAYATGKLATLPIVHYGTADGLPTTEFSVSTNPLSWIARDGRLWFATVKGLVTVDPKRWPVRPERPGVLIEALVVDGRPVKAAGPLQLKAGTRKLEFQYTALSLADPARVQFKYKLEGFDQDWIDAGNSRTAFYSSIGSGRFKFRVIACSHHGVWNDTGAALEFSLAPFFYQTWWFYSVCILGTGLLLTGVYRLRVRRMRRHERELARLVDDRTRELQIAEARMREAWSSADAANRLKSEFLANMSHEIRTPMNGILGMTRLAIETSTSEEQRSYLNSVQSSAQSLLGVINDVLDFSRIEAGRLELYEAEFDLHQMVDEALRPVALKAHEKGIELICAIDPAVPAVLGDATRLKQILLNLVGNAIKFTERGEIAVRVAAAERKDDVATIEFAISDTGIGIPADKQERIFEAFSQADGSISRQYGGTGLGLAICAKLVQAMHGTIAVESEPGQGSTFRFRIPMKISQTATADVPLPEELRGARVLVVDDHAGSLAALELTLRGLGFETRSAANGSEALALAAGAAERPFQLAVIDAHLPDMDGWEAARRLGESCGLRGPIVLMLELTDVLEGREERRLARNIVFLRKPVCRPPLRQALLDAAGLGQRAPAVPATAAAVQRLRVLLAEDNLVNQRFAMRILQKRGHNVTAVSNGREAVCAYEQHDFDVILMDVQMPGMNGFEATAQIRRVERQRGGHVPIVALTAHAMKGDRERCLDAGMDDYVSKPLDPELLFERIECTGPRAVV